MSLLCFFSLCILMDSDNDAIEYGDAEGAKALLRQISEGKELGQVVGNGAVAAGQYTGHARVPEARGQAIPAWDPRPLKATGVIIQGFGQAPYVSLHAQC